MKETRILVIVKCPEHVERDYLVELIEEHMGDLATEIFEDKIASDPESVLNVWKWGAQAFEASPENDGWNYFVNMFIEPK